MAVPEYMKAGRLVSLLYAERMEMPLCLFLGSALRAGTRLLQNPR